MHRIGHTNNYWYNTFRMNVQKGSIMNLSNLELLLPLLQLLCLSSAIFIIRTQLKISAKLDKIEKSLVQNKNMSRLYSKKS